MHFVPASVLLAVLISGIKTEAEPVTGTLSGPIAGSAAHKDGSVSTHDYIQAFYHGGVGTGVGGQHHVGSNGVPEVSSQNQDQYSAGVGGIADQVPHGSAVPHHVISGAGGHVLSGSSGFPGPYVLQKSDVSGLHFGGRAIGSPSPFPYYPSYYGKTYASPYYSQYQPNPYQAAVYQPQSFYPGPAAYQYSGSPYSPSGAGSAVPYSSPITPYSAYPYNYPYIPQYYPGYPSAATSGSYYQSSGAEIQSASKQ